VKVSAAWVKAPGAAATVPVGKTRVGEDGASLIFQAHADAALAVLLAQAQGKQIQLAVHRVSDRTHRILSGPVSLTAPEQQQLADCMKEL